MKDYRLSDIIKHCKSTADKEDNPQDCFRCAELNKELAEFCIENFSRCPLLWNNIEKMKKSKQNGTA